MKMRAGQSHFFDLVWQHRMLALVARRRFGKTRLFSRTALFVNMKKKQDAVYGSVRVALAMDVIRNMAETLREGIADMMKESKDARDSLQLMDAGAGKSGKALPADFTAETFMDLYDANRLEFRWNHSSSSYNRTKIIALTPQSVGETGWLFADEIGRVPNWREVQEAIDPIVQSDPSYRVLYCTTPPPDDAHPSFELLCPPVGSEFPVNPRGNLYRSEGGVLVLRVTAADAFADGFPIYDMETGAALTPDEARAKARDKDAFRRNFDCEFIVGGTSACGLVQLNTAQTRGVGRCGFFAVDDDADFRRGLAFLADKLGRGQIGIGFDVATTTKAVSNPSSLAVAERNGTEIAFPAIFTWKTRDPDVALERLAEVARVIRSRAAGGRARALAIDATSEKYFAAAVAKQLAAEFPVQQIVASEKLERPGYEPTNWKTWLGDQLVGELDDNHLVLPADRYLKKDWRAVVKDKGIYVCEPDAQDGGHGDTFDGAKLAVHALLGVPEFYFRPLSVDRYSSQRGGRFAGRTALL